MKSAWVALAVAVLVLAGAAVAFQWRYDEITVSTYPFVEKRFIRTNRFSGRTERLYDGGWMPASYGAATSGARAAAPRPAVSGDPYADLVHDLPQASPAPR